MKQQHLTNVIEKRQKGVVKTIFKLIKYTEKFIYRKEYNS